MQFIGAAYALVMVAAFPNVVGLKWTNPPERDLKAIEFRYWQVGSRDTIPGTTYYGMQWNEMEAPVIYPASPDSIWFVVPCRSTQVQYGFQCAGVDTAGNRAPWSNIAYKTVNP